MASKADWQGKTGVAWATHWERTDRSFTGLTDTLLGRASAVPFTKALDIGCGAGELSLALARGHPAAEFRGVDVSDELIGVAESRGAHLGNVSFSLADASSWSEPLYAPDLLVSRHGVMFFDDPIGAFANLHHNSDPHARLVFSCFRAPSENPWASKVTALLPESVIPPLPDPRAPGPFAFADIDYVKDVLAEAGWGDIGFEAVDFAFVVGSGDDPVSDAMAYFSVIGPAARIAAGLDEEQKALFQARLRRYLKRQAVGTIVALPAGAWIVTARKA